MAYIYTETKTLQQLYRDINTEAKNTKHKKRNIHTGHVITTPSTILLLHLNVENAGQISLTLDAKDVNSH